MGCYHKSLVACSLASLCILDILKNTENHEKFALENLKNYIFSFLNPFGSGSYRIGDAPRLPLYFVK